MNMTETIHSKAKLLRIVLASTVGSLLWAGCAQQPRVAVLDPVSIAHAPVDLTNRRPDTHPEQRDGFWKSSSAQSSTISTVVSPNVRPETPNDSADASALLSYNPEVINAVPAEAQDTIVIEAAGADQPQRRTWRDRWNRKNAAPQVQREETREIIIERDVDAQP